MSTKTKPRAPLDRSAWIDAGIDVLADEGVDGVRVEVLAKRATLGAKGGYTLARPVNEITLAQITQPPQRGAPSCTTRGLSCLTAQQSYRLIA